VAIDLNELCENMREMLVRLIGVEFDLYLDLDSRIWRVAADRGQVEQVLTNLVVNARDAMDGHGRILVATRTVQVTAGAAEFDIDSGDYVSLSIADTGSGMSDEVLARIFDPFFTTKGAAGTGLGLSTVYGIVKQAGGDIRVESRVGGGTRFEVLLPRTTAKIEAPAPPARGDGPLTRTSSTVRTLLLVEDESALRTLLVRALVAANFVVFEAGNGAEALEQARDHEGALDVLVTDLRLPEIGGRALADELRITRPGLGLVFMSGWAGTLESELPANSTFLPKPFRPSDLVASVQRILEAG
jgi:CheY-like chemotaxis protein